MAPSKKVVRRSKKIVRKSKKVVSKSKNKNPKGIVRSAWHVIY